jgi:ribosomal protein L11 methyltransferase
LTDSPAYTAGTLWRLSFVLPARAVAAVLDRLDDLPSVSAFEIDGGGDTAELWRIELLLDGEPDRAAWRPRLAGICAAARIELGELDVEPVPEADWLAAAARRHPPVEAGRILVHGSHARDRLPWGRISIEIDAGLAFGSGEHESTRGCLLAMDRLARRRRKRRILDMGCGSAVLAIAAAKLWPTARALAVDSDPVAVRVARENAHINRVAARVRVVVSEGYAAPAVRRAAPFDLIVANILADPLIAMAGGLRRHLARRGHAILSGLLDRQAEAVLAAHRAHGLRLVERYDLGSWATLVLRR